MLCEQFQEKFQNLENICAYQRGEPVQFELALTFFYFNKFLISSTFLPVYINDAEWLESDFIAAKNTRKC